MSHDAHSLTRVTLADVAARAGVSEATASRSLRGVSRVSQETRERVLDAARDLSYVTALQALTEQAGPRRTVAVIVPFITRWFFSTVTSAAVDYMRDRGYDVLLYHLGNADVREHFFERMPLARKVDGILSLSMPLTEENTLSLRSIDMPLVSVGSVIPGSPSVGIDEVGAARSAVSHLLHLRHERIALIAGRTDDFWFELTLSDARQLGYKQALGAAGIEFDPRLVVSGPHGIEGGAAAMAELLSGPVMPTAVFAEYDELAIGALWALRRAGLRVPQDMSVVSIDDHEMAPVLDLTTVAQNVEGQGQAAARMLLQLLGGEVGTPPQERMVLPTNLVLRGTTAPPS
jgi:LacI family transcriptional regulator, repressor for deo operon, udp, cdd, tsx, nupC, and nupG